MNGRPSSCRPASVAPCQAGDQLAWASLPARSEDASILPIAWDATWDVAKVAATVAMLTAAGWVALFSVPSSLTKRIAGMIAPGDHGMS